MDAGEAAVLIHFEPRVFVITETLGLRLVPLDVDNDILPAMRGKLLCHVVGILLSLVFRYRRAKQSQLFQPMGGVGAH